VLSLKHLPPEMHALKILPSSRIDIARCSVVLQKQQSRNGKQPPFILVQNEATICMAIFFI